MKGKVTYIDFRYFTLQNEEDHSTIMITLAMVYGNAITIQHPVCPMKSSPAVPKQQPQAVFSEDE